MFDMGANGQGWWAKCVPGTVFLLICLSPSWAQAAESEPDLTDLFGSLSRAPMEFKARASNGYSIKVEGAGRRVTLSTSGPAGTASYVVKGSVTRSGITANFGKRGRVDVRFRASRRKKIETPPNHCKGRPRVIRWGVFVGTIRFFGERGFTALRVGRAPGRTNGLPRWRCKRRPGADRQGTGGKHPEGGSKTGSPDDEAIVFEVSNRRSGLEAAVALFQVGEERLSFLTAMLQERRGRMRISRSAFEFTLRDAISVDSLGMVTVRPPEPFFGTATLRRNPDGRMAGSGSLAIALPGSKRISLIRPSNKVRLYRLDSDGIAKPF